MIWGSMFGNGEEAFETSVETGEESAGLEAGLPIFVATPGIRPRGGHTWFPHL